MYQKSVAADAEQRSYGVSGQLTGLELGFVKVYGCTSLVSGSDAETEDVKALL